MQRGLAAIVAVGLRPCSGAILVLVFALAQGLFWLGVVSTFAMGIGTAITVAAIAVFAVAARGAAARFAAAKPGPGMIVLRALETGAAVLIVLFGAALLTGYLASERLARRLTKAGLARYELRSIATAVALPHERFPAPAWN